MAALLSASAWTAVAVPSEPPRGDANSDGALDSADIMRMLDHLENVDPFAYETILCVDLTNDQQVTEEDLVELVRILEDRREPEPCSLIPPIDSFTITFSVQNLSLESVSSRGHATNSVSVRNVGSGAIVAGGYFTSTYSVSNTIFVGAGFTSTAFSVYNQNASRLNQGRFFLPPVSVLNSDVNLITSKGFTTTPVTVRNLVPPAKALGKLDGLPPVSVENIPAKQQ
jgi:hypothetical protein